jgi:hypothetical protein
MHILEAMLISLLKFSAAMLAFSSLATPAVAAPQ